MGQDDREYCCNTAYNQPVQIRVPQNGRPVRLEPIGADDIINLQIALGTSDSLESFLKSV